MWDKCSILLTRMSHVSSLLRTCFGSRGSQVRILPPRLEGFLVGDYGFKLSQVLAIITIFPQGILPQDLKLPQGLT